MHDFAETVSHMFIEASTEKCFFDGSVGAFTSSWKGKVGMVNDNVQKWRVEWNVRRPLGT